MSICNFNVVEHGRARDIGDRWYIKISLEFSQACLVDLSLTGGLWVRILERIRFSFGPVAMAYFSCESFVVIPNYFL